MLPTKITKPQQKPPSKPLLQPQKGSKSIDEKKQQKPTSVQSKSNLSKRDPAGLLNNASKKKDENEKKLRTGSMKEQAQKSKDTKTDNILAQNKEKKLSKKHGHTPQIKKPITNIFAKKAQTSKPKDLQAQKSKNLTTTNLKANNEKQKKHSSESDISRTLSNDEITVHIRNKRSKNSETNGLANTRENNLMAQKHNPQTKRTKNKLISTDKSQEKSDSSRSSAQTPPNYVQREKQSKPKSTQKTDPEFIRIPSYSEDQLKKIDLKLDLFNEHQKDGVVEVTLTLMSWIWEAHLPSCKNSTLIDSFKCLRKLFNIYENAPQTFYQAISLEKTIFQRQIFKQSNSIGSSQKSQLQQSSSYSKSTIQKSFVIQNVIKDIKSNNYRQFKPTLIFLLFEIIIFNYDEINNLDEQIPSNIIRAFRYLSIKGKKYQTFSQIDHKILQELIAFIFSELNYLKTTVDRSSPQFMKKKRLQILLWRFFKEFTDIFTHQIKAKEFINFGIGEAFTLETSLHFMTQFTHYARRFPLKNLEHSFNIIEFEKFAEAFIQRVIEFNVNIMQLKDRQKNVVEVEIDGPNRLFGFNLDLPIYDWAVLAIKSDQRKTFDNLVKYCKKLFFKNLQKKSTSKYETFIKKPYINDKYARFTIQQLPQEDVSFYDNSIHHQPTKQSEQQNSQYKLSYEKLKGFVSIPHMNFLVFKEIVPQSVKRLAEQSRKKISGEKLDVHLLYLLILSNSSYLLQLIKEIEYSCIEMMNPNIGKGLVRLCGYCHEFKSKVIGQKFLKLLRSNSLHKQLMEKIFEKDNDYQRRLSTQMMGRTTVSNLNEVVNENRLKVEPQKIDIQAPEVLEVRVNSCESMYFELIMEIENVMPLIRLDHYLQQLLKKPNIFRPDKFYVRLLQTQHLQSARVYFHSLITNYIDDELRTVDLMTYFIIFAQYSLKKENFDEMLKLVQSLSVVKLIKFHCLLFTETFSDQISYKILIPDGMQREEKFSILTSAGYEEKTKFVDQHFSTINELILWREYIKSILQFDSIDKYVCIKCFFTIVHQVFSEHSISSKNNQYLDSIIEKLKVWIQKDKIDQVASAFHFLSLTFFPQQQSKINSNLSKNIMKDRRSFFSSKYIDNQTGIEQKMTLQILYLIRQQHKALIDMFKNKQTLTIRCLGQEMRKRASDENVDQKVDEMKRKQVMKMLNKMKNTHDYMIRCIVRFVENINLTNGMLKNFYDPEYYLETMNRICKSQHMQKEQKRSQGHDEYYTPKLTFKLSSVSSNNIFQHNLQRYIKKYNERPNYFHQRYHFLAMIRCIAEMWIDQKLPSSKDVTKSENETKNKSQFIVDKKQSKMRDGHHSLSGMIPIDKIFEICIECLNEPISSDKSVRECEMLKQKLVAFETLSMLFISFTTKFEILKFMAPSIAKSYKTKYHDEICQITMLLLMKNTKLLGKDQKDLVTTLRLRALTLVILNFKSNQKYNQNQWSMLQSSQQFWFLINTLIFDKNSEIRFFIIKTLFSRDQKFSGFRGSIIEKLVASLLIASQESTKSFAKIARKSLTFTLERFFVIKNNEIVGMLAHITFQFFVYLVNLNTVYFLQKNELKLEYKDLFMMLIDFIFDKREAESYLYAILDYFNDIAKSSGTIKIEEIFTQIKWPLDLQIEFYMMPRPSKIRLMPQLNSDNNPYRQLVVEIDEESSKYEKGTKNKPVKGQGINLYTREYPRYNEIFRANILEALAIMDEVFLERAAKGNRKQLKTKKPLTVFRVFDGIFNPNLKNRKEQFISRKAKNEERKEQNEIEIDI